MCQRSIITEDFHFSNFLENKKNYCHKKYKSALPQRVYIIVISLNYKLVLLNCIYYSALGFFKSPISSPRLWKWENLLEEGPYKYRIAIATCSIAIFCWSLVWHHWLYLIFLQQQCSRWPYNDSNCALKKESGARCKEFIQKGSRIVPQKSYPTCCFCATHCPPHPQTHPE